MYLFLHGGRSKIDSKVNKSFFQTICKNGNQILIVPFGWNKKVRQEGFEATKDIFIKNNPEKSVIFDCASNNISVLRKQITNHDIIYLSGGSEMNHLEILNQIVDIQELLKNKVIVGISGGTNILGKYYYTKDLEQPAKGLGLLPIKVICHRGSDYSAARTDAERLEDLENYGEKLPIYKIPEQEYIEMIV